MKLLKVEIENFKCFQKFKVKLDDFNVVIGVNNSGKTTILQALIFSHYLIRKCVWSDRDRLVSANKTDYVFDLVPNMFVKDLWFNQKTRGKGNISVPIKLFLEYEQGLKFEFETHYRYGGLNHKVVEIPTGVSAQKIENILTESPLLIPASTGIVVHEEYRASGVRDFLISSGRSSELIRSFLYDIGTKSDGNSNEIELIRKKLRQVFGITDLKVEWDEATDPYMRTFYKEKGNTFDLVSGGSGFIQFIQILSKIYYRKSSIVIIDEPDAHLNPNLVYDMVRTLQEYAKKIGVQVIIATHSKDVLDIVEPEQIFIIDSSLDESKTCDEAKTAAYEALGIELPVRELAYLQMFSKVLLVEGSSDTHLLQRFGTTLHEDFKSNLRNIFVLPIKGRDNFDSYVNFFNSLRQKLSKNIDVFFLRDRNNLTDEDYKKKLQYYSSKVKKAVILKRNELESYLLLPKLFTKVLTQKGVKFTDKDFRDLLSEIKSELEINLETVFEQSYAKLRDSTIGDTVTRNEAKSAFRKMLSANQFAVLPGKEALKKMFSSIEERHQVRLSYHDLFSNLEHSMFPNDLLNLLKAISDFAKK